MTLLDRVFTTGPSSRVIRVLNVMKGAHYGLTWKTALSEG